MNTHNQPNTRDEWLALVDEQDASGLSQTEFCKQRNLILHRFTYYKQQRNAEISQQAKASFAPIKVNQISSSAIDDIKINLPNGFYCQVPHTIAIEKLKAIIGALLLC